MCSATNIATSKKEIATAKSKEIEIQSKEIAIEKGEAEEALAEALPELEAARTALAELDKSDITEIRYFVAFKLQLFIFHCYDAHSRILNQFWHFFQNCLLKIAYLLNKRKVQVLYKKC